MHTVRRGLLTLILVSAAVPALAQAPSHAPAESLLAANEAAPADQVRLPRIGDVVAPPLAPGLHGEAIRPGQRRLLTSLYAGTVALQALDAHSTFRALDAGHVEANPLMRWSTNHPVAFVSMKAAATATTIYFAERIRKRHPKRAVLFMVGINAATALVVAHNYRAVR